MNEIVTLDLSKFRNCEIEMAKELLDHIFEANAWGNLSICLNTYSGCVFLSDENCNVWMMNGDNLEKFYSCGECGEEGFAEDLKEYGKECCIDYLKQCGEIADDVYICPECRKEGTIDELLEDGKDCCKEYLIENNLIDDEEEDEESEKEKASYTPPTNFRGR